MGVAELQPSLIPAELVAIGNARTAKMMIIMGSRMRTIIFL